MLRFAGFHRSEENYVCLLNIPCSNVIDTIDEQAIVCFDFSQHRR